MYLEITNRYWKVSLNIFLLLILSDVLSLPEQGLAAPINVQDAAAREVQRQQQRERVLREQQELRPDVHIDDYRQFVGSEIIPDDETPCFQINKINLVGNAAEQFLFALKALIDDENPVLGRCLGVKGINAVITRIQNAIISDGYVTTRVLAAPQDLKSGILELTVIPGRVRDIHFQSNGAPARLNSFALPVNNGEILNLRDIEQGLENFKRIPSADADFKIEPAQGKNALPGESDLRIQYKQESPLRITLSLDDGGAESTGRNQAGLTVSYDNLLSINDLLYVSLNHDFEGGDGEKGTKGFTAHYSFPAGYWLISLIATENEYRQTVAQAAQDVVFRGDSKSAEVQLSRVVYRDAVRKTTASVKAYLRRSNNFIDDVEVQLQRRRTAGWQLDLSHREFIGVSTLDLTLGYRRGTGAFGTIEAPEDAFNEGSSRPSLFTTNASLNIPFTFASQNFRYNTNIRYQQNFTPLVPQDRFTIGGRYTVRGFDGENVLSADRGWLIRNDISVSWKTGHEFYYGVDYGEVAGQSSEFLLGRHLAGEVLGLRGQYKKFSYDAFVGRPISNPKGFKTSGSVAGFNLSWTF